MTFFDVFNPLQVGLRELLVGLKLAREPAERAPVTREDERAEMNRYLDEHPVIGAVGVRPIGYNEVD